MTKVWRNTLFVYFSMFLSSKNGVGTVFCVAILRKALYFKKIRGKKPYGNKLTI